MKSLFFGANILLLSPIIAHAQGLEGWISGFTELLGSILAPLIVSIAILFFIWNAAQFFIFQSDSEEGRNKAKSLMIWGLIALVFIIIIVGVINLFTEFLNLDRTQPVCSDYAGCL